MEAVGLAAGVVQLAQVGVKAAQEVRKLVKNIKRHSKLLTKVARRLESNARILRRLEALIRSDENLGLQLTPIFQVDLTIAIDGFREVVDEIKAACDKAHAKTSMPQILRKVKYSLFQKDDIDRLYEELGRCQIEANFIITVAWQCDAARMHREVMAQLKYHEQELRSTKVPSISKAINIYYPPVALLHQGTGHLKGGKRVESNQAEPPSPASVAPEPPSPKPASLGPSSPEPSISEPPSPRSLLSEPSSPTFKPTEHEPSDPTVHTPRSAASAAPRPASVRSASSDDGGDASQQSARRVESTYQFSGAGSSEAMQYEVQSFTGKDQDEGDAWTWVSNTDPEHSAAHSNPFRASVPGPYPDHHHGYAQPNMYTQPFNYLHANNHFQPQHYHQPLHYAQPHGYFQPYTYAQPHSHTPPYGYASDPYIYSAPRNHLRPYSIEQANPNQPGEDRLRSKIRDPGGLIQDKDVEGVEVWSAVRRSSVLRSHWHISQLNMGLQNQGALLEHQDSLSAMLQLDHGVTKVLEEHLTKHRSNIVQLQTKGEHPKWRRVLGIRTKPNVVIFVTKADKDTTNDSSSAPFQAVLQDFIANITDGEDTNTPPMIMKLRQDIKDTAHHLSRNEQVGDRERAVTWIDLQVRKLMVLEQKYRNLKEVERSLDEVREQVAKAIRTYNVSPSITANKGFQKMLSQLETGNMERLQRTLRALQEEQRFLTRELFPLPSNFQEPSNSPREGNERPHEMEVDPIEATHQRGAPQGTSTGATGRRAELVRIHEYRAKLAAARDLPGRMQDKELRDLKSDHNRAVITRPDLEPAAQKLINTLKGRWQLPYDAWAKYWREHLHSPSGNDNYKPAPSHPTSNNWNTQSHMQSIVRPEASSYASQSWADGPHNHYRRRLPPPSNNYPHV